MIHVKKKNIKLPILQNHNSVTSILQHHRSVSSFIIPQNNKQSRQLSPLSPLNPKTNNLK